MSLSKATAEKIVQAVSGDAECVRRTQSFLRRLPDSWMQAGPRRDDLMFWKRMGRNIVKWKAKQIGIYKGAYDDESDARYADYECSGIADAAEKAIRTAMKSTPGIPGVAATTRVDRMPPSRTLMQTLAVHAQDIKDSFTAPVGLGMPASPVAAQPVSTIADDNHSAVGITMSDGTQYVFDWFMTLNVIDPIIFYWWMWQLKGYERSGTPYSVFGGFGDPYGNPPKA